VIELAQVALNAGDRPLLEDLDARFEPGEFVAVLGRNGAGKTTLLRAVAGLHPLARGEIRIDGSSVAVLTPAERALCVALVASDDVLFEALRVRDVVAIGRFPHHRWWQWHERPDDEAAVGRALEAVGIGSFAQRFFATLSSGERQRVWIALGLAQDTPVLLLDEPTSHLDVRVAHDILKLLRAQANEGKAVVCALHDLNEAAAYADRIALLGEGRLLAADSPEVVFGGDLVERAYGIVMERVRLPDGSLRLFARNGAGGRVADANDQNC